MLREDRRLIDGVQAAAVGLLMLGAYAGLYVLIRDHQPPLHPFGVYIPTIALIIGFVIAGMRRQDVSVVAGGRSAASLWYGLALACAFSIVAYGFAAYTLRIPHLSRRFVYGGLTAGYLLSCLWLTACYYWNRRGRAGRDPRRVLLVGGAETLSGVASLVSARSTLDLEIAGTADPERDGLDALGRVLDSTVVDFALFGADARNPELIEDAMRICHERGVEIWLKIDAARRELVFSKVDYLEEIPVLVCSGAPRQGWALAAKRLIDVAAAITLLVVLSPVLLLIAAAVKLDASGPMLFRQRRIGLNGREFILLKFRSMRPGAEESGSGLRNEMSGPVFKMKDDPRVTPLGRWLRKYSLDELPQIWNVLVGEMSLVGPRPPLRSEVERYEAWQRRRLSMRPGMTGLWQVNGRNDIRDFNEWVRLDLRYLETWSLMLDLKIMLRTVPTVLRGTGL